jgi:hypothetical protein
MMEVDYLRRILGVEEADAKRLYQTRRNGDDNPIWLDGRIAAIENRLADIRGWINQLGDNHELTALLVAQQKRRTP